MALFTASRKALSSFSQLSVFFLGDSPVGGEHQSRMVAFSSVFSHIVTRPEVLRAFAANLSLTFIACWPAGILTPLVAVG